LVNLAAHEGALPHRTIHPERSGAYLRVLDDYCAAGVCDTMTLCGGTPLTWLHTALHRPRCPRPTL